MILIKVGAMIEDARVPRLRGDDPKTKQDTQVGLKCSPLARG